MLVSFICKNFKSFQKEIEFSLLASPDKEHLQHIREIDNRKILTTSLLYGENASGKSNLIKGVMTSKGMICTKPSNEGQRLPHFPFLFDGVSQKKDSSFEYFFSVNGNLYKYGFSYNSKNISKEWLKKINGQKEQIIFSRSSNNGVVDVEFSRKFLSDKNENSRISFIAEGTWSNELFLKRAADEKVDIIKPIYDWFYLDLVIVKPDGIYTQLEVMLEKQRDFIKIADKFMKSINTGVNGITLEKLIVDFEKDFSNMPAAMKEDIERDLVDSSTYIYVVNSSKNIPLVFTKDKEGNIVLLKLKAKHRTKEGSYAQLDWDNESDGTKRILHILPAILDAVTGDKTYFFDEIERSLHPSLTKLLFKHILKLFAEKGTGQLIASTHTSQLLDQDLIRRDEIKIIEKGQWGKSQISSLYTRKGIRKDLNLEKNYIEGKFYELQKDHSKINFGVS